MILPPDQPLATYLSKGHDERVSREGAAQLHQIKALLLRHLALQMLRQV